jgi:MerR family transcriptional regulator, light-induced transcriptional regulator
MSYQIADLEQLTGIKAHTIRIWEKRYCLIEPQRTSTNIRFYDDEQVKKLLNVSTLISMGYKISRIAKLSSKELSEIISQLNQFSPEDAVCASYINELTSAMISYNEPAFEKVFSAAITRFGIYSAMMKVFYPFLFKTGVLWTVSKTMPAQEHFASAIMRRKLLSAIDGLPPAHKHNKSFLLFLPPNEWHETGLLFADYLIRSKGYRTTYLGQNVPFENLDQITKQIAPTALLTFVVARTDVKRLATEFHKLCDAVKGLTILVSGATEILNEIPESSCICLLREPADLEKIL